MLNFLAFFGIILLFCVNLSCHFQAKYDKIQVKLEFKAMNLARRTCEVRFAMK